MTVAGVVGRGVDLERRRDHECRLTADRALDEFDDAVAFALERGVLTMTPDCSLPSLFFACHEEPYSDKPGYGQWPKTKWWWGPALSHAPGILTTKLHKGRTLFLSDDVVASVSPRCLAELAAAENGAHGDDAAVLIRHLAAAGPSLVEDVKAELGLDTKRLRSARTRLEKVGALVSSGQTVDTGGGHRHTGELRRWDQVPAAAGASGDAEGAVAALVVAGVRAAVIAPEDEVRRSWFTWKLPSNLLDELVESGHLTRPSPGVVTCVSEP